MSSMTNVSKLAQLRAKTDRQLIKIINKELELGLHLAFMAPEVKFTNHFDGEPRHAGVEESYAQLSTLLSKVEDVAERRRLEKKLTQLREALDGHVRVRSASS